MSRYGYYDMPENYSDVAGWSVSATCVHCGRGVAAIRESCWIESGELYTECGCTELEAEHENATTDT